MKKLYTVILAAGKGTRMKSDLPKVLFKIKDKTLIEYCVETAKSLNPEKVIVVVGHEKELIQDILKDQVSYAIQDEQLGTGHALMQTKDLLDGKDGYVLVSNGDMPFITKEMFEELHQVCLKENAAASMMSVETEEYPSWGRVVRNENGHVLKIVEAKDASEEILNIKEKNTGVYCFKISDLFSGLDKITSENAQAEYYLTDVIEIFGEENKKVISVITDNYQNIIGINTPEELKQARKNI